MELNRMKQNPGCITVYMSYSQYTERDINNTKQKRKGPSQLFMNEMTQEEFGVGIL